MSGSVHVTTYTALRSHREITARQALGLLCQLAGQVVQLHALGRIHANLTPDGILVDEAFRPAVPAVPEVRMLTRAMRDWLPSELRHLLPLELPMHRDSAASVLRAAQTNLDPFEIDLHQLRALTCQLIVGDSAEAYLRSPRVKGRVSPDWQPMINAALGCDGHQPLTTAEEFLRLLTNGSMIGENGLSEVERGEVGIEAVKPGSDTSPSIVGKLPDLGKRRREDDDTGIQGEKCDNPGTVQSDISFDHLCHYEIVGWIGQGGMGDVYRGYERVLDRTVALKVLPTELSAEPDFVRRFYAEASAAARVIHPHVIRIHFIGEDHGRHFFAMQYVDGESLAALLARRERLSADETIDLLEQVLSGLGAAHRQGLIHRDIKPGNILLDRVHQRALLADFGLVKSLTVMEGRTATGVVMGTVDYIAPEQGRGLPVDNRCDLYAVGVLAYQMLSGKLPYTADSPTALIFQHVYEPAPPLSENVPPALVAVVAKLMAKSREARHASAEAVLADLRAIRTGHPLPSRADTELAANPQVFLRAAPVVQDSLASTHIIRVPQFAEELALPENAWLSKPGPGSTADSWRSRLRQRWHDWVSSQTPEWIQQLQTTQQQVSGAVAECERRRNQLRGLMAEADDVLTALRMALAAHPDDPDLRRAVADQQEQQVEIGLRLSQVEATLRQLCHRRDLLQARFKAAQAKIRLAAKPDRGRRMLMRFRLPSLLVLVSFLCVLAVRDRGRIGHAFTLLFGSKPIPDPPAKASIPASTLPAVMPIVTAKIERKAAFAGRGTLFAISIFHEPTVGAWGKKDHIPPELKLWDLATGSEVVSLEQPHRSSGMAISPDGQLLVSAGRDAETGSSEIKIWELQSGKLQHHLKTSIPKSDATVGFSSDSRTAYSLLEVSQVKTIGVIDVTSGRVQAFPFVESHAQATAIAFCPLHDLSAVGIVQAFKGGRAYIDLYDLQQRRRVLFIPLESSVRRLTLSDDGTLLAGSQVGQTVLWRVRDGSVVAKLPARSSPHEEIAFSHDATVFAASSRDGIDLMNLSTNATQVVRSNARRIAIGFTTGGTLAAITDNGRLAFFDPASGKERLVPKLSSN